MRDVLAEICAEKRAHIARAKSVRSEAALLAGIAEAPPVRPFAAALERHLAEGRYGLIAEIKKASPSAGLIRADFDPRELASAYAAGGASCLSVLTDAPYFQGNDADLTAAREAVGLPVLRKDFILDAYQVLESRRIGADCILLIMAALSNAAAAELAAAAAELGLDVLVEIHEGAELDRALRLPVRLTGINNRNLKTLDTDLRTAE
ncbi:MAG: indole-3-glycerol-phosphate synthase, partial [Alphaproteobacteria bacterium]|nr:indole-3-glycerol-phosphate synthase [Alphaproteobacteria bacterium]